MKAQTCPKCDGWKQVQVPAGTTINFQPCPVCNGTGYILVPEPAPTFPVFER